MTLGEAVILVPTLSLRVGEGTDVSEEGVEAVAGAVAALDWPGSPSGNGSTAAGRPDTVSVSDGLMP